MPTITYCKYLWCSYVSEVTYTTFLSFLLYNYTILCIYQSELVYSPHVYIVFTQFGNMCHLEIVLYIFVIMKTHVYLDIVCKCAHTQILLSHVVPEVNCIQLYSVYGESVSVTKWLQLTLKVVSVFVGRWVIQR